MRYFRLKRDDGKEWVTDKLTDLLEDLGLVKFERSLRNSYKSEDRWVKVKDKGCLYRLERFEAKRKPKLSQIKKVDKDEKRILAIPDLHTPFLLEGYLDFCIQMYEKHNCNTVVFLGDILDNHYSSYHESDPDGLGGKDELELAREQIQGFYKAFPVAKVCIGNHDAIIQRKAYSSGLPTKWIKTASEVLGTPNWEFAEQHIINGIEFTHGTGRSATARCQQDMISVVQSHFHSKSFINMYAGKSGDIKFAMQLGCGIDKNKYAFAYGKNFAEPHINVGLIVENGKLAFMEYMDKYK